LQKLKNFAKKKNFCKTKFRENLLIFEDFRSVLLFTKMKKIGIRFKRISIVAEQELHQIDGIRAIMKIDDFNCLQIQKGN
jgi:hypothetical protein